MGRGGRPSLPAPRDRTERGRGRPQRRRPPTAGVGAEHEPILLQRYLARSGRLFIPGERARGDPPCPLSDARGRTARPVRRSDGRRCPRPLRTSRCPSSRERPAACWSSSDDGADARAASRSLARATGVRSDLQRRPRRGRAGPGVLESGAGLYLDTLSVRRHRARGRPGRRRGCGHRNDRRACWPSSPSGSSTPSKRPPRRLRAGFPRRGRRPRRAGPRPRRGRRVGRRGRGDRDLRRHRHHLGPEGHRRGRARPSPARA